MGILGGGHYVAYAHHLSGKWLYFNDSSCKEVCQRLFLVFSLLIYLFLASLILHFFFFLSLLFCSLFFINSARMKLWPRTMLTLTCLFMKLKGLVSVEEVVINLPFFLSFFLSFSSPFFFFFFFGFVWRNAYFWFCFKPQSTTICTDYSKFFPDRRASDKAPLPTPEPEEEESETEEEKKPGLCRVM